MAELNIQIYWGPRPEKLEALAEKIRKNFFAVTKLGTSFESWVKPAKSKKLALTSNAIDLSDAEQIRELLLSGQNKTDTRPRTVIPELGYSIRLWNLGGGDIDATISLRSAVNSEFLSQDAQNMVNLTANAGETLLPIDVAIKETFHLFADIWSPQGGRAWTKRDDSEHVISEI